MKSKIIKNTQFYLEFSDWINSHDFDNEGRPLDKNGIVYRGSTLNGCPILQIKNNNGKGKRIRLHRMVAFLFIPNPKNLPVVKHINGDRLDFRLSNLEWSTQGEIVVHSMNIGRALPRVKPIVATNVNDGQILKFSSRIECGEYFGVNPANISIYIKNHIRLNRLWFLTYMNNNDNDRISVDEFNTLINCGKVKEHPIFKGYYANLETAQIISTFQGQPRILKTSKHPCNYYRIYIGAYKKSMYVHRFIMECNIGESIPKDVEVDHIDANTNNNTISNLQILSRKENLQKAINKSVDVLFENGEQLHFASISECAKYFNIAKTTLKGWSRNTSKGYHSRQICSVSIKSAI